MDPRVQLAGEVRLSAGAGTVADAQIGRQAQVILAVLAVEGRPVRREELAEAIWGERLPASWDTALRGVVARLRELLTDAWRFRAPKSLVREYDEL